MNDGVVLCVPHCEGPVAKAFEMTGLRPLVVASARPRDLAEVRGGNLRGAVLDVTAVNLTEAMNLCKQLRGRRPAVAPILLVLDRYQLDELNLREDLFDDFLLTPVDAAELAARLRHRLRKVGESAGASVIELGELTINLETYQASIAGRSLDLTFMEYELLRFLATNSGKPFTRQTLLSRVWGYEYYGGTRTVDVHVRRLRAKLGEEHAHLISTMRSVGYKFGPNGNGSTGAG